MFGADEIKSLNETELEVYKYITHHRTEVLNMKIRDLADAAHVSTTTVLRFCKKIGCDGYSEFKLKYKMELSKVDSPKDYDAVKTMLEYFHRVDTKEFDDELNNVASLISKRSGVIFLGIGTSGILAKYGARFFSNIGKFSQHIDDPFYPVPDKLLDDSVVIVLSVSGETKETIDQLNKFRSTTAIILSITNMSVNTIASMSDINLAYYMPMTVIKGSLNLTAQVPVVFILETLAKKVRELESNEQP